jgi:hypothetical protein
MPLRYENAYGGFDESVPEQPIEHLEDMMRWHPGVYPRNPAGKGYVVFDRREAIDGRELPNIEHPQQVLTPETLVAGGPDRWWRQPLAWSCDWFDKAWYPRIVHYRGIPDGLPPDDRMVPEVKLGWLDPGHSLMVPKKKITEPPDSRIANAASPALVLPFLRGDEAIELTEMTPNGRIIVRLPADRPRIRLRHAGRMHDVEPVPHRILVSTEEMGVYVVWHGAWHTPERLPRRLPRAEDPASLGLEGIDVVVDDLPVEPLDRDPPPIARPPEGEAAANAKPPS